MQYDILINNCSVLTPSFTIVEDQSIVIEGDRIVWIGPTKEMAKGLCYKRTIQGKGKLAMPGFVDGHTHLAQQMLRGVISDEYPIIYQRFNIPYESNLTERDVRLCADLACLEMIKSGITAFADAGGPHTEAMIPSILKSGLRAAISRSTADIADGLPQNMVSSTKEALDRSIALYREYNGCGDGRIRVFFQIRSTSNCTDELISEVSLLARAYQTRLHMHMAEYPQSTFRSLAKHGVREPEHLDSLGVLGPHLLAAHCILLTDQDIRLFAERGVHVVHCPRSNLGKGITRTPQLLGLKVPIGIGTDGTAHSGLNIFKEITAFKHSQIAFWGIPYADNATMPSSILLEMATLGSAKAMQIDSIAGTLEQGKKADLILLNIDQPHLQPSNNLVNSLAEAAESADINDMIVNGEIIMRNREVLTLDETKLLNEGKKRIREMAKINSWQKRS